MASPPPLLFGIHHCTEKLCRARSGGKGQNLHLRRSPPCAQYVCTNMSQWRARGEGREERTRKPSVARRDALICSFGERKGKAFLSFPPLLLLLLSRESDWMLGRGPSMPGPKSIEPCLECDSPLRSEASQAFAARAKRGEKGLLRIFVLATDWSSCQGAAPLVLSTVSTRCDLSQEG